MAAACYLDARSRALRPPAGVVRGPRRPYLRIVYTLGLTGANAAASGRRGTRRAAGPMALGRIRPRAQTGGVNGELEVG
jgi:hypothetical protein